jgi:putative hemolysin
MRPPVFVPEGANAARVLERFRGHIAQMGVVIGEHGGIDGVITINDVVTAIVGEIDEPDAVQRDDGSWLVDGLMPFEEFTDLLDIRQELEAGARFSTVAGFVIDRMGTIPDVTDSVTWGSYRFEVVDMDGQRVDKILIQRRDDDEPVS